MTNAFRLYAALLLLASSFCIAQAASPTPQATTTAPAAASAAAEPQIRGAIPTYLTKTADSKKLKEGDPIVCKVSAVVHSGNGMVIPSGSTVYGHVTQSKARSKGDTESSLAMVFDKIRLPNGKDLPMKGILQAVAPNLGGNSGPETGAAGPGTIGNGAGANLSTTPPPSPGAVDGPNSGIHPLDNRGPIPMLTSQSVGVLGIHNLEMDKDSVLTTAGKEVKLNDGTQMLIRAEIQGAAQ